MPASDYHASGKPNHPAQAKEWASTELEIEPSKTSVPGIGTIENY